MCWMLIYMCLMLIYICVLNAGHSDVCSLENYPCPCFKCGIGTLWKLFVPKIVFAFDASRYLSVSVFLGICVYLCFCVLLYLCICISVFLCNCILVYLCFCVLVLVYLCSCVIVYLCFCVLVYLRPMKNRRVVLIHSSNTGNFDKHGTLWKLFFPKVFRWNMSNYFPLMRF